ncbi:cell division protein FtsA [Candidatus Aerophobetes bacterium]|nr:cell division protein FtsA [Candidatus Aerophobetes bacterium]
MKDKLIAGLDIGTTKICVLIARVKQGEDFEILGVGTAPSQGLKKGVISDIKKTSSMIKAAVRKAEARAGLKIKRIRASIAGNHIQGTNNQGFIKIEKEDKRITSKEVEKALEEASHIILPSGREIIHILPQEFVINGQNEVKEPIGITGTTLGARVHVITASSNCRQDIENSVESLGYKYEGVTLQCLASSMATLSPDEEDLGVALLDIGGGTTDLAVFLKKGMRFTYVLGVGGNQITNDIAVGFHTTKVKAEEIKIRYGAVLPGYFKKKEEIEVEKVAERGAHRIKEKDLLGVIQPRVEEMFELVDKELKKSGYKDLITAGVVLTGGSSLLKGIKEKAEEVLGLPARIGYTSIKDPQGLNNPIYATAVGLILYGIKRRKELASKNKLRARVKRWLKDFF